VLFLTEFPLTATGKVQRFRLREHALAVLAERAVWAEAAPGSEHSGETGGPA
jgi:acyl-CoA synthetase (AMP-forming)/AMP-acid ligase II